MSKLMGLDCVIQYRKGYENKVVDALSWCLEDGGTVAITALTLDWFLEVTSSYSQGEWTKMLMKQLTIDPDSRSGFTLKNGVLRYRERLVIGEEESLRRRVLKTLYDSPVGGTFKGAKYL